MSKHRVTDADRELFLNAIGEVSRISSDLVEPDKKRTPPLPRQRLLDEQQVTRELLLPLPQHTDPDAAEPLRYLRDGYSPKLLSKLGRGQFSVRDQIDLHQMTQSEAREAIRLFLKECLDRDLLCVKIIHGKGMRSKGDGPVLKGLTDGLLRQNGDVIAFRSARHNDGGSGAVIVLLKGRR